MQEKRLKEKIGKTMFTMGAKLMAAWLLGSEENDGAASSGVDGTGWALVQVVEDIQAKVLVERIGR